VVDSLGVDRERIVTVIRTPPDVALYHRHENPLFPSLLDRLGSDEGVHAVVLPRTDEQRDWIRALALPSLLLPDRAIDAQSLIAFSDLVVSAGGTMNREAVALGVPVYTTFRGRLGGVDEALVREGRLRPLEDPGELELVKLKDDRTRTRRDPTRFLDLLLPLQPYPTV
jgi:predicted glycosyltransferase